MDDKNIPDKPPSPWLPITNAVDLAVLGKAGEEASELSKICHRITIQGIDEIDPSTGKVNRETLEDEIADNWSTTQHAIAHFGLDIDRICERAGKKQAYTGQWFDMLRGNAS